MRELGRGGMATVYLAVQHSVNRRVALKVLPANAFSHDPQISARFMREARIVARLQHSNIINIYDIAEFNGGIFMAMEYLSGGTLADRINPKLTVEDALLIIKQLCEALVYAHNQGFIHRDIKPENILFTENHKLVLSDFGIARALSSDTQLTRTGLIMGTPKYMSPEQIQGSVVNERSDLYSLGALSFELLTGGVPFDADSLMAMGMKHLSEPIPDLPSGLRHLQGFIEKLMAKKQDDRFESAETVLSHLDSLISQNHPVNKRCWFGEYNPQQRNINMLKDAEKQTRYEQKNKFGIVSLIVALLLLVVSGLVIYSFTSNEFETDIPNDVILVQPTKAADTEVDKNAESIEAEEKGPDSLTDSIISEIARAKELESIGQVVNKNGESAIEIIYGLLTKYPDNPDLNREYTSYYSKLERRIENHISRREFDQAEELIAQLDRWLTRERSSATLVEKLDQARNEYQISDFINKARLSERQQRFWIPSENNAAYYYHQVLDIDPNNKIAQSEIENLIEIFWGEVERTITREDIDELDRLLPHMRQLINDKQRYDAELQTFNVKYQNLKQTLKLREEKQKTLVRHEKELSRVLHLISIKAENIAPALAIIDEMQALDAHMNNAGLITQVKDKLISTVEKLRDQAAHDDALALLDAAEGLLKGDVQITRMREDIVAEKNARSLVPVSF